MNFSNPLIENSLNNSIIYEEYKGNFAVAHQIADNDLKEVLKTKNNNQIAEAKLALGIIELLMGNAQLAIKNFDEIEQMEIMNECFQLRVNNFQNLAMYLN